jgi:hypothetical protein
MTITSLDLRVMQSQRMTDFSDGGGRMSATEVVDGQMNNVFPDQSDLDRINGRVSLRKIFLNVDTDNADTYLGAFGFLTDPPLDPSVACLIFTTQSPTDLRSAARSYVENYRIKGSRSQLVLYGTHLAGQSTLQMYCRPTIASPDIGDVLCLSIEASGYAAAEQFVAVQEVLSRQTVRFYDAGSNAEFDRDVLIIRITTALGQDFPGRDEPIQAATAAPTLVRTTQVSDGARYYGVLPLTDVAEIGDLSVKTETPYVTIVPTTTAETPLVDQLAGLGNVAMIRSGAVDALSYAGSVTGAAATLVRRYLGTPYTRRSLFITIGATQLRDDGHGGIVAVDPSATGWSGEADYTTGAFAVARDVGFSGTLSATATPAGGVLEQGQTFALDITAGNRNTSYVFQLSASPAPGTVSLDYLALGKWIRLSDTGAGQLAGNAGEGSATLNYSTGTLAVTLGALPDVDSQILLAWGTDLRARNSSGDITTPPVRHRQVLAHGDVVPGTLVMTWETATVAKTASANAAGVISGDASGTIDAVSGTVLFTTSASPDANITYSYDYAEGVHSETFTPTPASGTVSFTLGSGVPLSAGSVRATWVARLSYLYGTAGVAQTQRVINVVDDSAGAFSLPIGNDGYGTSSFEGTINYTTGAVSLDVEALLPSWVPTLQSRLLSNGRVCTYISAYTLEDHGYTFPAGTAIDVRWQEAGASEISHSEGHPLPPIDIYLGQGAAGPTVPGSLRFTFRGRTYVDRAGSLVYGVNSTTNAGTAGGSFDYVSNVATISDFGSGSGSTVAIESMLTRWVNVGVASVLFRAPGTPLRPGNFTVRATTLLGTLLTASADINGVITGTLVRGEVSWGSGAASVSFGEWVTAAGNEAEPWYDPDGIVEGEVWKPTLVDPSTVFFGCVVFRSIPVDPELIGIDPVRLPSDGRVVAIRAGDTIIIHNTQELEIATPVAGTEHDLGRPRLAFCEVFDATGAAVESIWYTQDLDAGTHTWADPLNLSAYTMPITLRHRIEDAMLCTDVQITGEVTLQRALTHEFGEGSQVSAAITYGDMQARYTNLFDQATYSAGVWSDVVVGANAAATYNDVVYPIGITNDGAIDERWALVFTSSGLINVIGESVGQVLTSASIASTVAPINPVSGEPYFSMAAAGFGSGWAAGNVIRFNTISATRPTWVARVTKPGPVVEADDRTRYQVYGNAY